MDGQDLPSVMIWNQAKSSVSEGRLRWGVGGKPIHCHNWHKSRISLTCRGPGCSGSVARVFICITQNKSTGDVHVERPYKENARWSSLAGRGHYWR